MKEVASVLDRNPTKEFGYQPGHQSPASAVPACGSFWQQLFDRVHSWFEIPYGYEDENGFHYGREPAPRRPATAPKVLTDRAVDAMSPSTPTSPPTVEDPGAARPLTLQ